MQRSRESKQGTALGAEPYRCGHVAIVGRPSVGKSTLMNALIGQKVSITSKKPQTTRHRIVGIDTRESAQLIYVDTPGFQTRHRSLLNERLNNAVREALDGVDVVVFVIDATRVTEADRAVSRLLPDAVPVVCAVNKIDLVRDKALLLPLLASVSEMFAFASVVPISAERGTQLEALRGEIVARLPQSPPLYPEDDVTDRDERFLAAEFIREKIFRMLGDEIPYATTVGIEQFKMDGALRRIHATVYVDKASQRAILLGEGGSRMKAIATEARHDMERLFDGKVFLEVFVKVKRGWADSDASLTNLGY
jgi:GTP-binding protein Era